MAASIIGALRAVLGLDTAQFEQGADRASAKTGVLKSALMEGAAALAEFVAPAALATAGVAALAKGMEMAKASLDFADELDATSAKIGITAESLQTLRFAAQDADIDAATLDSSMQALNATLGALQSGIGDGKIRKAFEALGIPQSQIEGMRDASDLLPLLADRIAKVGSQAEQVQIAKKLGVEDLLPLLQRGAAGIAELQGEARSLGLVIDGGVVTAMADMSREVEKADDRMSAASATIGNSLAPAFVTLKNVVADALNGLAEYLDRFREIENRATSSLETRRDKAYREMSKLIQDPLNGFRDGKFHGPIGALNAGDYNKWKQIYDDASAELERRREAERNRPGANGSASGGGGSSLSSGQKERAKKQGSEWADLFAQARANRESYNERKALADRINGSTLGEVIATEADRMSIAEPIANAVEDGVGDGLLAARQTAYDTYRDTFAGAIDAGLRGGSKGVLDWLGWQLSRSISDMLANMGANAATGGGWLGKAFTSIGSLLGIGNNADGTTNWRGGMTWVGERGPELLTLPRGSAITPAHMVEAGGGGLLVSVAKSDLFDVTVRRVSREEAQSVGVQAVQASTGLAQEKQARAAFSRIR